MLTDGHVLFCSLNKLIKLPWIIFH